MPKRKTTRRVARRPDKRRLRRRPATGPAPAPARSGDHQLIEGYLRREHSRAIIDCWIRDAQVALFAGDLKWLTRCLHRLGKPDRSTLVNRVLDERLWRQLELAQLRGWSPELIEKLAERALQEPSRLSYLREALAEHDPSFTELSHLAAWSQRTGSTRAEVLDTAVFVDLWLTIVSICDPTRLADADSLEVRHAQAG